MTTEEQQLREYLRTMIREMLSSNPYSAVAPYNEDELKEMSTTGNVAGYLTPGAFRGNAPSALDKVRARSNKLGYKLTKKGEEDIKRRADTLQEAKLRYHEYKNDESAPPRKKIARAISELNKNLQEVERVLKMNSRLQTESGITSEALWKRTQEGFIKLEARLLHLAGRVRDIRGK